MDDHQIRKVSLLCSLLQEFPEFIDDDEKTSVSPALCQIGGFLIQFKET